MLIQGGVSRQKQLRSCGAWCRSIDLASFIPLLAGRQFGCAGWWWHQALLAAGTHKFVWWPWEHKCMKVSFPCAHTTWLLLAVPNYFTFLCRCPVWYWPAQQEGVHWLGAQRWHLIGNPKEDWKERFLPWGEVCAVALPGVRRLGIYQVYEMLKREIWAFSSSPSKTGCFLGSTQ